MRLASENINEKFTEESDPIEDMGIGYAQPYYKIKKALKRLKKGFGGRYRLTINPKDITGVYKLDPNDFKTHHIIKYDLNTKRYWQIFPPSIKTNSRNFWEIDSVDAFSHNVVRELADDGYLKKLVNEKFEEQSDPIQDLRIGLAGLLKIFIEELKQGKYDLGWYEQFNNDDDLLWISSKFDKIHLVKYLLDKGANIHHKGDRALRWAVATENYEMAQFLLENGANVNGYDSRAYELAEDKGNIQILELLKKYGAVPPTGNRPILEEAFTETSDPIFDMGIGIINKLKPLDILLCKKIIKINTQDTYNFHIEAGMYSVIVNISKAVDDYIFELSTYKKYPKYLKDADLKFMGGEFITVSAEQFFEHFDIVKSDAINEKFEEESDPIHDLGIGVRAIYDNIKAGDVFVLKRDIPTLGQRFKKGVILQIHSVVNKPDQHFDKVITYSLYISKSDFKNKRDKEYSDWSWSYEFFKDYMAPMNMKESVNEKFEKESDPIHDMKIGIRAIWDTLKKGDVFRFKKTLKMTRNNEPTDEKYLKGTYLVITRAVKEENKDGEKSIGYDYYETTNKNFLQTEPKQTNDFWAWDYQFFAEFFELVSRRNIEESLNEKFEEDDDPIHSMGIGMERIIKDWIEKDLKELNVDYNSQKKYLLEICAQYGKYDFVKYLVEKGTKVKSKEGNSALNLAAINGHIDVVKYLLEKGADPKDDDSFAMRWAARQGHYDVVKVLLEAGAYARAKGDYALKMANNYGHKNIVKLLTQFGSDPYKHVDVKESVNEKFEEESDPIKDLNVGHAWKSLLPGDIILNKKRMELDDKFDHFYTISYAVILDSQLKSNELKLIVSAFNGINSAIYLSQKYLEDKDIITRLNFQRWEETHDIQIWEKYFTIFRHPDFKEENTPTQIDEKFSEESDPVADLSIGLYKFWQEKYAEIGKTQPRYTYEKYFDDNYQYNSGNSLCVYLLWDTLLYLGQKINPQEAFNKASVGRNNLHKRKVARTLKKHFYVNVKVENVNEKFKEESDPISDLGIGMREQITKFMIDHAEQYNNKEDMLRVSCIFGKPEFIKFLIADGANIHINKDAPLREAAHIGCIECMQLLLDAGANIDAFNGAALTWAVQNEQYEVVEFLLANGADININDGKAIREACATYDVKMAKILFDHGADVHAWKNWILKTVWGNNSQMDKHIDAQLAKEKIKNK